MKPNTFYFTHDFNARSDEKIKLLLMKWGMTGYGVYWSIIEDLYQNANAMRLHTERIAFELRVPENMVNSIIQDFDLFVFNGEFFGSLSVQRRIDERFKKSERARDSAFYRWDKMRTHTQTDANALQTQSDSNAIKERKGKEKKRKENKVNKPSPDFENSKPDGELETGDVSNYPTDADYYYEIGLTGNGSEHETPENTIGSDLTNEQWAGDTPIPPDKKKSVKTKKNEDAKTHTEIIKLYSDWMESRNLPARIDASDAASVKKIVSYLSKFEKVQSGERTVVDLLKYVFDNWMESESNSVATNQFPITYNN
jgi:hypothetical protein